jgi:hypothetical protein
MYILAAQRHLDDYSETKRLWRSYEQYLRDNETVFPKGAFQLATSDWVHFLRAVGGSLKRRMWSSLGLNEPPKPSVKGTSRKRAAPYVER